MSIPVCFFYISYFITDNLHSFSGGKTISPVVNNNLYYTIKAGQIARLLYYYRNVLQLTCYLYFFKAFDYVSDFNIVEVFNVQSAFVTCLHLFHIVFETFQ